MTPPRFSMFGSYPVRACAEACGIDYSLALQWVDAETIYDARRAREAIVAAHTSTRYLTFTRMIERIFNEGRVRVRRWGPNTGGWRCA